ncbi:hypothetical protein [uncultured Selenomonas sp.]|uniref:hypothetical protein n=1 Tax=uncultured Selenomonas sp. TaxID=159275 RepID=UPI0025E9E6C8|nr:hypothetical protein [uncultured Selenomonas sp.]MDD6127507.1 hypothetical protein [Veillonellaceae bacterium]
MLKGGAVMRHFYSEIDNISLTYCDPRENEDGLEILPLHFERPRHGGFDTLDTSLPVLYVKEATGFSKKEIVQLLQYARNNASILWSLVKEKEAV